MNRVEAQKKLQEFLALSQANRLMKVGFVNDDGPEALLVINKLEGKESLSKDFRYQLELLSDEPNIALKDVLGKLLCVELAREDGSTRYFTRHVFEFAYQGTDAGLAKYKAILRPWLAYLRNRRDNCIFHHRTLTEQTSETFADYGSLPHWDISLVGDDPPMTDAVQFGDQGESNYNYLHRRWSERGWFPRLTKHFQKIMNLLISLGHKLKLWN